MLNTQITAERIKAQAKQKGISVKNLLENCELGVNTVTKMSSGKDIVSQNLLKIANYLDCSVDYLLGRTETPEINTGNSSIKARDVNVTGDNNNTLTINNISKDDDEQLLQLIKSLDIIQRSKVITIAAEMKDNKEN